MDRFAVAHRGGHRGGRRRCWTCRPARLQQDRRLVRSGIVMAFRLQTSDFRLSGLSPSRSVLPNAVVFIGKETRTTPSVAINVGIRAGSACDPVDAPGATW